MSHRGNFMWLIRAFSVNTSVRNLLSTESTIHCLRPIYGIRFLTMMWLFLGWTYEEVSFKSFYVELRNLDFRKNLLLTPVLNYTVAVDTLFFISGLLTSYIVLQKISQDYKVMHLPFLIIYRLRRTMPSLMLVIVMTIYLPMIGSGPMWHDIIDPVVEGCKCNWWTNLLYINNYVGTDTPCLKNSWFFAVDFQLYLMTLIIIFILSRYPKIGMVCNLAVALGSIIITGFITWKKKLPPTLLFIHPDPEDRKVFSTALYQLPYSHAGACCIGICVGYILFNYPKLTVKVRLQIIGWSMAAIVNCLVIYGVYNWNQSYEIGTFNSILYASTHRMAWALVIAWLVFICCKGYGGVINEILSWKSFEPLSRLTFSTYIMYNLTSAAVLGQLKEDVLFQSYFIVGFMFFLTIMTYGISFIAGFILDAPLLAIIQHQKNCKANISKSINSSLEEQFDQNGIYVVTKNN